MKKGSQKQAMQTYLTCSYYKKYICSVYNNII